MAIDSYTVAGIIMRNELKKSTDPEVSYAKNRRIFKAVKGQHPYAPLL